MTEPIELKLLLNTEMVKAYLRGENWKEAEINSLIEYAGAKLTEPLVELNWKEVKNVLDYYNLPENGFYTDVISQEICRKFGTKKVSDKTLDRIINLFCVVDNDGTNVCGMDTELFLNRKHAREAILRVLNGEREE